MRPFLCGTIIFASLALAACAPEGPPIEDLTEEGDAVDAAPLEEAPPVMEQCDAAEYRPLVGTSIAATTLPAGENLRVYGEADIITQEYLPQRTNVVYDADGIISRVYCG